MFLMYIRNNSEATLRTPTKNGIDGGEDRSVGWIEEGLLLGTWASSSSEDGRSSSSLLVDVDVGLLSELGGGSAGAGGGRRMGSEALPARAGVDLPFGVLGLGADVPRPHKRRSPESRRLLLGIQVQAVPLVVDVELAVGFVALWSLLRLVTAGRSSSLCLNSIPRLILFNELSTFAAVEASLDMRTAFGLATDVSAEIHRRARRNEPSKLGMVVSSRGGSAKSSFLRKLCNLRAPILTYLRLSAEEVELAEGEDVVDETRVLNETIEELGVLVDDAACFICVVQLKNLLGKLTPVVVTFDDE